MHDTAYRIGGLVMDTYLPSFPAKILEIGSQDVNGTLRDHSPRNAEYIGLDFEEGKGVDVVITGVEDWNVPDSHFDLVMASSVFEHDKTFWKTFLAMCQKVKPGGHIYINVPSNGTIHRYPKDYWRFYPDSGLALEEMAQSEGFDLTLIESFVAEREADVWNDFCAVFRREPYDEVELNRDFVHDKVRCTNALNWRSSLIVNPVDDSEDTRLLRDAREEKQKAERHGEHLAILSNEQERVWKAQHIRFETERAQFAEERAHLEARLAQQTEQNAALAQMVEQQRAELARLVGEAQVLAEELENERTDKAALQDAATMQINEISSQKSISEQRLHERFREIGGLTRLIQERDQYAAETQEQFEWLRQVACVLTREFSLSGKRRVLDWLPAYFSHKRQKALLKKRGLFDAAAYTSTYPDVSASKADPLRHYVNHGILEGRVVKRG